MRACVAAPVVVPALLACLLLDFATTCSAQTGPPEKDPATGVIIGQIVEAGSNRPVAGAVVILMSDAMRSTAPSPGAFGMAPPGVRVMTTNDGRYAFRALRKGTYWINATKPGYLPGAHGARGPNGASQPIDLQAGMRVADAVVTLWRYGTITGTVVDEAGEPAVAIPVRAFRRSTLGGRRRYMPVVPAMTDDRGVYRIPQLVPGDYVVSIVSTQVAVPTSLVHAVRDDLETAGAAMTSSRMQLMIEIGAPVTQSGTAMATEIGNLTLPLGRGAIPPPPHAEGLFVYPTVFYPSAVGPSGAATVTVGSGEERAGIDLQIAPVRCVRVSGTIMGPEGPADGIPVRIVSAAANEFVLPIDTAATISDAGGAFTFPAVPHGQYTLRALRVPRPKQTPRPDMTMIQSGAGVAISYVTTGSSYAAQPVPPDPTLWAELPLAVGGDNVSDVVLTLRTGARASGRVEFDGTAPRPKADDLSRLAVVLDPVDSMQVTPGGQFARVEADGQFRTYGTPPGRYVLTVTGTPPPNWTLKSATLDGRDITDAPLTVSGTDVSGVVLTFTDRPSSLSGTVHGSFGGADRDAVVVVFPSDPQYWTAYGRGAQRLRSTRTSRSGTYGFTGLPAGDYFVGAVEADSAADWQDPKFLEGLAQVSTSVHIQDGETKVLDLRTK